LKRLGGNISLLKKLIQEFASHYSDTADNIWDLWRGHDTEGAMRLAHKIKGVAGNIGAVDLSAAARDLETVITGRSMNDFSVIMTRFETALAVVLESSNPSAPDVMEYESGAGPAPTAGDLPDSILSRLPELARLLRQGDVEASECLAALIRELKSAGPLNEFKELQGRIKRYEFDKALDLLNTIARGLGVPLGGENGA
jgi:two-component system sensor histidine kinase/response regulator